MSGAFNVLMYFTNRDSQISLILFIAGYVILFIAFPAFNNKICIATRNVGSMQASNVNSKKTKIDAYVIGLNYYNITESLVHQQKWKKNQFTAAWSFLRENVTFTHVLSNFSRIRGHGIQQAFIFCLQEYLKRGSKRPLVVFEDDARPVYNNGSTLYHFEKVLQESWPNGTGIILLGAHNLKYTNRRSYRIQTQGQDYKLDVLRSSYGAYAYMVHHDYAAILANFWQLHLTNKFHMLSPDVSWYKLANSRDRAIRITCPMLVTHVNFTYTFPSGTIRRFYSRTNC